MKKILLASVAVFALAGCHKQPASKAAPSAGSQAAAPAVTTNSGGAMKSGAMAKSTMTPSPSKMSATTKGSTAGTSPATKGSATGTSPAKSAS